MNMSLTLLESDSQIRKVILQEILNTLDKAIKSAVPNIVIQIKDLVREALKREPEYQSLISGKLKAEFGIPFSSDVDVVVDALVDTLQIKNNPLRITNLGIAGGFTLTMMKSDDLDGVINIVSARVIDQTRGYSLPWLEWLLLKNNQILVRNYKVRMQSNSLSRSGMALMVDSNTNWRVPPEFSGSQTNNWTTRAVTTIEDKITKIIRTNIETYIS